MVRKNMIIFYNRGNYTIYELRGGEPFFICISRGGEPFFCIHFRGGEPIFTCISRGGEKIFNGNFQRLATYMSHYHCILPNRAS